MTKPPYIWPQRVIDRAVRLPNGAGIMTPIEDDRPAEIAPALLEQDGIAFVQSTLAEQGRPLASRVAALFNDKGFSFAPLEKGESLESAKQFKTGQWRPTQAIQKWLAEYIELQWGKSKNGYQLVFEDPWMKPGDIERRPPSFNYFFSNDGVYYAPGDKDGFAAMEEVRKQSNFLFFGYVVTPPVPLPPAGKQVDQDYIELLAHNTQMVFVRAYDWEGYVVWRK